MIALLASGAELEGRSVLAEWFACRRNALSLTTLLSRVLPGRAFVLIRPIA